MKKQWKFYLVGLSIALAATVLIFKPQISEAIKNQYVLWHLDRLNADRYQVITTNTLFTVVFNKGSDRFVFYYHGPSDIAQRVSTANEFTKKWPENRKTCENSALPKQESCLITGSMAYLAGN